MRRTHAAGTLGTVVVWLWLLAAGATPAPAATSADVAVDPDGNASFAWTGLYGERTVAEERRRTAAGVFADSQILSSATNDAQGTRVAVAADGTATYVWTRYNGTRAVAQTRRRTPAGALSAVQTLSGTTWNASEPQVALAPDGTAIFAWQTRDDDGAGFGPAQARSRAPDGTLSAVQNLSAAGLAAGLPRLVIAPDGTATFSWLTTDGNTVRDQTRRRLPNGAWGATRDLATAALSEVGFMTAPQLGVDPNGRVTFVWAKPGAGGFVLIQARRRLADGTLEPTQGVTTAGPDAMDPQVAVAADGTAAYAWRRGADDAAVIQTRRKPAGGALTAPATLTPAGANATEPRIGIAPDGVTTFAWTRSGQVETRRRPAAGGFDTTRVVSTPGATAEQPDFALGPGGTTHFVWEERDSEAPPVIRTRRRTSSGLGTRADVSG
ncbi:MAG TPA: hypothetical protein VF533_18660 [Solirubrobacteraceae bacterium]|jgi:hypothetical protein